LFGKILFGGERDMRRFEDSLVGGFGCVVVFESFRADSFFGEEFHGGAEEVMKEPPLMTIEVIKERDDLGIIEALVAEPLTDMGPVFLFDMSVVVFVVGSGASKLDGVWSLCEMS